MEREVPAAVVESLRAKLSDPSTRLEHKYRMLFSLRGITGPEAHAAMLDGELHPLLAPHPAQRRMWRASGTRRRTFACGRKGRGAGRRRPLLTSRPPPTTLPQA